MRNEFLGAALVLAFAAGAAQAERVASPPSGMATIDDGEGHARVLVAWTPPTEDEPVAVSRATLRFGVSGESESRSLRVRVYPITSAWNPQSANWTSGWSRPGGDFDEDVWSHATIDLGRGAHDFSFDVTNVVKEAMEEGYEPYGFLITAEPGEGIGFAESDATRLAGLENASIEVSWRRVPPAPGSKASR